MQTTEQILGQYFRHFCETHHPRITQLDIERITGVRQQVISWLFRGYRWNGQYMDLMATEIMGTTPLGFHQRAVQHANERAEKAGVAAR